MIKPVKISTVVGKATVSFDRGKMNELINMHFLGSRNCNKYEGVKIVSKKHKNMKQVEDAHYNLHDNQRITVEADLMSNGDLINFRIQS